MTTAIAAVPTIEERYHSALLKFLATPDEVALLDGYDLGRTALSEGHGVLDVASIHASALADVLNRPLNAAERERILHAQTEFFMEALSPFEMGHRAFRDANETLRRMNDMLEAQAKQIAFALHSEAGQLLASLHFELAEASRDVPVEKTEHLLKIRETLLQIEERLRNLSHELRPPVLDDLGLAAALSLMAQGVTSRWALPVIISVDVSGDMPGVIENTVYRIIQEALTNSAKHADATRADVRVRQVERRIMCSVADNGSGFDDTGGFRKQRPGLGLTEMKERVQALGGVLSLKRNGERGTELRFEIPLDI
jgi:signal transduction histidine kinase